MATVHGCPSFPCPYCHPGVSHETPLGMTRFNDSGAKAKWRDNVSAAGKRSAEHRRCPDCGRGAAVSRKVEGETVTRWCRWCRYLEVRDYSRLASDEMERCALCGKENRGRGCSHTPAASREEER